MWWRGIIVAIVLLILWPAVYAWFWRISWLAWFYRRMLDFRGFLRPTEQAVHFGLGAAALPVFWLLGRLLGLQFVGVWCVSVWPSCTAEAWSVIAALFAALLKEIMDVFVDGYWQPHDSIVDVCFWFLGGLTAPLFWWAICDIVVSFDLLAHYGLAG